jgi:hypothetical protein
VSSIAEIPWWYQNQLTHISYSGLAALAAGFRKKVGPKGHRAYLEKNKPTHHPHQKPREKPKIGTSIVWPEAQLASMHRSV